MDTLIKNGKVILPGQISQVCLGLDKGKIVYIGKEEKPAKNIIDAEGDYVSAGFIDLHCHGMGGGLFEDATEESFLKIERSAVKFGVTLMFACLTASRTEERVKKVAPLIKKFGICGIYIEGPFISQVKKGSLLVEGAPNLKTLDNILKAVGKIPLIMVVAPEVTFGMPAILELKKQGAIVSLGHSDATFDEAKMAIQMGASNATHLFNAMSGLQQREPGIVGAVLDSKDITAELILDGLHVHPAVIKMANKILGIDRLIFITDATSAAGTDEKYTRVYDGQGAIIKNGVPVIGNKLAGSILTLDKAIKNFIDWTGTPIEKAILPATLNPAKKIGLANKKGSIELGKDADIIIFDKDIKVQKTLIFGKEFF